MARKRKSHTVGFKAELVMVALNGKPAVYAMPRLSAGGAGHKVYPHSLRGVAVRGID